MDFITNILKAIVSAIFKIEIKGTENIPDTGSCVVCINHISLFDPLVIYKSVERPIIFIGKQELFKIPVIGWFLKSINVIPVKRGSGDIGAVKAALKTLKDGGVLGIFPTGTREKKNPNADVKGGAAMIALKAGAPVIPINIKATYRIFSKVYITVGRPVDLSEFEGRKLSQEEFVSASEKIYKNIKSLGDNK